MKRIIDRLIEQVRRSTDNQDYTETSGIQTDEILQYFNDGQDELQTIICSLFRDLFQVEKVYTVTPGQEAYSIPFDAFLNERVDVVEYSPSGNAKDYYHVKQGFIRERLNSERGDPVFYIRRSGEILLQPAPQSAGLLRVTYQKKASRLDIKRGVVSSVTLSGSSVTSLFLDPLEMIDDDALVGEGFISVVDYNGTQKMRNIPISAVNTTTGEVSIRSGFTFEDGETISVGDCVVAGYHSSTHSTLPDQCEKYLLEYVAMRLSMRDSSVDTAEIGALLQKVEATLTTAFAQPDGDVKLVPIINTQFLIGGDY